MSWLAILMSVMVVRDHADDGDDTDLPQQQRLCCQDAASAAAHNVDYD